MSERLILIDKPDGTASAIGEDDLAALAVYLRRCRDEAITWSLGCGCRGDMECGYHMEQSARVAEQAREDAEVRLVGYSGPEGVRE
jgi:hypothetical protein